MAIVLASTSTTRARARVTARSASLHAPDEPCHVLDLDGSYRPLGGETVTAADPTEVARLRLTLDHDGLVAAVTAAHACGVARALGTPVLALVAGVTLVSSPASLLRAVVTDGLVVLSRTVRPEELGDDAGPALAPEMYAVGPAADLVHRHLCSMTRSWRHSTRALDLVAAAVPHRVIADDATLVTRFNAGPETRIETSAGSGATRGGLPVVALDLSGLDPRWDWVVDARELDGARRPIRTGPLLSRNPDLVGVVRAAADLLRDPAPAAAPLLTDDPSVRALLRAHSEEPGAEPDSLLSPQALEAWLTQPVPAGDRHPVARYLAQVWSDRPDLRATFPHVPGVQSEALARWAVDHGVTEPRYAPELLRRAAERTRAAQPTVVPRGHGRPRGVNLVGYLAGELGIGESARLMERALAEAGVPSGTVGVSRDLGSRTRPGLGSTDQVLYDTTLLCVNADQTPQVSDDVADVVQGTYRIGMWYWEVESFPPDHPAFRYVDEIWVATDFVRDAITPHSPVPVRTVMPPLPQRTADPVALPERLGIPTDRPWFLFMFDFLSTAERKNPWGLVEAFTRAFPEAAAGSGPLLVIKSMNGPDRPKEAERLRLLVADRDDVLLVEEYLQPTERDALVALCTAYVSLHRAEGLGLTMAEAMAWGKPVVATGYSGNTQFMTDRNSYLVPWTPVPIPDDCAPYPAGEPWADPDLDAAAAALRRIVDDPAHAATIGARAAADIRELHSAAAAGQRVRAALTADGGRGRRGPDGHARMRWIGSRFSAVRSSG